MQRPLILGASVSADWSSLSPGKKLALRYTQHRELRTVAYAGTPGVETLKKMPLTALEGRSIVIALDLFFWDSTHPSPDPSLFALRRFLKEIVAANLPIVLGDVPELLPGRQGQRERINKAIHESCRFHNKCLVFSFDQLHQQIKRDGFLEIQGRKLSLRELVPDGLHLASIAGDYLTDMLKDLLAKSGFGQPR